jgi:two-component system, chemotaxis family, response regulator WspR
VIAEKLLAEIERLNIAHSSSPVCDRVTLSIGIAGLLPTPQLTAQSLLSATDIALYEAKKTGRARIVVNPTLNQL